MNLNDEVRGYWEQEPCGSSDWITSGAETNTKEWFDKIEAHRYAWEPCIHSVAQFSRYNGKKILEVGVGAGTDHLQWARSGCDLAGVDLTDAAIDTTKKRLELYGFESRLKRLDAELLPFADETFDVVYSWGVIHHSEDPEKIIKEIYRVLKKDGHFIGMLYGRYSLVVIKLWLKHALFKLRPFKSFNDVVWNHMESVGTKSYTTSEIKWLLHLFSDLNIMKFVTPYDTRRLPNFILKFIPNSLGWFIGFRAIK